MTPDADAIAAISDLAASRGGWSPGESRTRGTITVSGGGFTREEIGSLIAPRRDIFQRAGRGATRDETRARPKRRARVAEAREGREVADRTCACGSRRDVRAGATVDSERRPDVTKKTPAPRSLDGLINVKHVRCLIEPRRAPQKTSKVSRQPTRVSAARAAWRGNLLLQVKETTAARLRPPPLTLRRASCTSRRRSIAAPSDTRRLRTRAHAIDRVSPSLKEGSQVVSLIEKKDERRRPRLR